MKGLLRRRRVHTCTCRGAVIGKKASIVRLAETRLESKVTHTFVV